MIAVTDARAAADKLVALIRDACERVEIAGSIRRGKAEVHDAELVVIPRAGLWPLLDGLVAQGVVGKAVYSDGKQRWGQTQRGVDVDGVMVEIFTADAINWGYQLWLRTGPGPANTHVMKWRSFTKSSAPWQPLGGYIHDAKKGQRLIVPDEATMFAILGVAYIPPHERTLALYESLFKRGHKWGDISQIARAESAKPAAKPAPGAPKYAPYTGTVYVPQFDHGEIVTVDGQRYAVARIVCNMRSNVVPKGQPFEYELRPLAAGERVVYAWEYQIAAYAPEAPVAVIAESVPVAPVVESQPVAEVAAPITPPAPLLLPSCDLRPLRDAVTEILAAHPPTNRPFISTDNPWAVSLGEIHWDGVRWFGQWIVWQADGVVIYEAHMGKSSAQKGTPITYNNFRYYPACSFGEFCDLMADAYAVYGQQHPRHRKYMYSWVPDGKHKMPAGDVAAEAYRRWRVAQRVNRPQRVTVTPDVIALPASMAAPPQEDFIAALSKLCAWLQSATVQYLGKSYVVAKITASSVCILIDPDQGEIVHVHLSLINWTPERKHIPTDDDYSQWAQKVWGLNSEERSRWHTGSSLEDDSGRADVEGSATKAGRNKKMGRPAAVNPAQQRALF